MELTTGRQSRESSPTIVLSPSEVVEARWRSTGAETVLSAEEFIALRRSNNLHVINVNGDQDKLPELFDEASTSAKPDTLVESCITERLEQLQRQFGDSLVVSSSGVETGVPGLAYRIARERGVRTLAVVADQDIDAGLVKPDFLVPGGRAHGDSANTAAQLASSFFIIGGGGTERMQLIAGAHFLRPVTIVRGFKGASQSISVDDLPNGVMLSYRNPLLTG